MNDDLTLREKLEQDYTELRFMMDKSSYNPSNTEHNQNLGLIRYLYYILEKYK